MRIAHVPVRVNFLGGWSDQESWPHEAAVVNAAIGWQTRSKRTPYPIAICEQGKVRNAVKGIGTGLGISSILAAAKYRLDNPGCNDKDCILAVLDYERKIGTFGGWQDQVAVLSGGVTLTTTSDHNTFRFEHQDNHSHPIMDHLVLVDTGIRRPSKMIGDRIRELMETAPFHVALSINVSTAKWAFNRGAEDFAWACIDGWKRLVELVPEMEINLPHFEETWGHMLVGAGGGGFGLYFVKNPDDRKRVIRRLKTHNLTAHIPVLMDGIKIINA